MRSYFLGHRSRTNFGKISAVFSPPYILDRLAKGDYIQVFPNVGKMKGMLGRTCVREASLCGISIQDSLPEGRARGADEISSLIHDDKRKEVVINGRL